MQHQINAVDYDKRGVATNEQPLLIDFKIR